MISNGTKHYRPQIQFILIWLLLAVVFMLTTTPVVTASLSQNRVGGYHNFFQGCTGAEPDLNAELHRAYGIFSYDFAPGSLDASKKTPLWSSTKNKSSVENAFGHWKKHGKEFPEIQNAKQYAEKTKDFLNNPPKGTLTKTRPNGDILRYDPKSNTFGVKNADDAPKTMFRPTDGINYWNKQ